MSRLGGDSSCVTSLPLVLTLAPLLPRRTPSLGGERSFRYGFQLRLPDGPMIDRNDPLLAALGAEIITIVATREHGEALQDQSIDPGAELRAVGEPLDEDGDEVVGVWDSEKVRCAGLLPSESAARVAAALEQGIAIDLLAVSEERAILDDRRMTLEVLVFCRAIVDVAHDRGLACCARSVRPAPCGAVRRHRGDLLWWDASAASGPADITELPVSQELRRELKRLHKSYAKLAKQAKQSLGGYALEEVDWKRKALAEQSIRLWRRARSELARQFAVGYLGPGMDSPAWSPAELPDDEGDEEDYGF